MNHKGLINNLIKTRPSLKPPLISCWPNPTGGGAGALRSHEVTPRESDFWDLEGGCCFFLHGRSYSREAAELGSSIALGMPRPLWNFFLADWIRCKAGEMPSVGISEVEKSWFPFFLGSFSSPGCQTGGDGGVGCFSFYFQIKPENQLGKLKLLRKIGIFCSIPPEKAVRKWWMHQWKWKWESENKTQIRK